jgi:hypothetical protein
MTVLNTHHANPSPHVCSPSSLTHAANSRLMLLLQARLVHQHAQGGAGPCASFSNPSAMQCMLMLKGHVHTSTILSLAILALSLCLQCLRGNIGNC